MKAIAAALAVIISALTLKASDESPVEAIAGLDRALDMRMHYIDLRRHRIDSLEHAYAIDRQPARLIDIADAFTHFANDSALHYFELATEAADNADIYSESLLKQAAIMPLAGLYDEAIRRFEAVDPDALPSRLQALYHESGRQLYSYIASAYEDYRPYRNAYLSKAIDHQHQLLDLLDQSSDDYLFNLGEYYFLTGDMTRAEALLGQLVENSDDKNLLARAHHHLSTIARQRNDNNAYRYHLANSAIADIEAATLEVKSLQELGSSLSADGDVDRSYRYLSTALDNAVRCGATLRMIESSRGLPLIAEAHNEQIARWRQWIYAIIGVMAVLLLGFAVTLILLYREMRRLDSVQRRLREANSSKDVYIGQFLQLCSIYMDKLNRFCKIAERKISAGKADEFYRMTKSGKFIEEQSADFYNVFDDAFLHLYPDFTERVNALLRPECRITLAEGERLNTDLRILAIKRMGIDDAASIAQILNYSLNTIYAYRNRLKSRAIDRDNFEENVMKIPSNS